MTEVIPHPGTGEALDVKRQPTDLLSHFHDMLAERERDLRTHRRAVDDELVERMDHEGVRTFHAEDFTIEVSKPTEREWDIALLRETLDRLVRDGIISATKARSASSTSPRWSRWSCARSSPTRAASVRSPRATATCPPGAP
jgi:hypothetical protein